MAWLGRGALREAGGILGLLLIIAAIFTPPEMLPPIVPQLAAIAGAVLALLLWRQGTATARIMGSAPLAGIGLISYSAYLWHQPILAFARSVTGLELGTAAKILAVLLTLVLSYLSWRFIETPFRDKQSVPPRRLLAILLPSWTAIIVGALIMLHVAGSPDAMMTALQKQVFLTASESPERKACHIKQGKYVPPGEACVFNSGPAAVAVLGNSHGVELAYALGQVLAPEGVAQFTYSACPPLFGQKEPKRRECARWTADVMDYILHDAGIGTVVIAYSMTSLADGIAEDEQNEPARRADRRKALFDTVDALTTAGKKGGGRAAGPAPAAPRPVLYPGDREPRGCRLHGLGHHGRLDRQTCRAEVGASGRRRREARTAVHRRSSGDLLPGRAMRGRAAWPGAVLRRAPHVRCRRRAGCRRDRKAPRGAVRRVSRRRSRRPGSPRHRCRQRGGGPVAS